MKKIKLFSLLFCLTAFCATAAQAADKTDSKTKDSGKGAKVEASKNPTVTMETSLGNIEIELFKDKAPISVENFLKYVSESFYDKTIFHRVISTFMIQGGGFTEDMKQKSVHAPIKNEANNGVKNDRGTLAMARTSDVNSATAQFFINTVDNDFLNYQGPSSFGYAVFGKVTKGMDVVDKIKAVPTTTKGMENVPVTAVVIKSIKKN
jgi:peptidyl-prolyl cis-trans isomerase A (cyclophilin A)